MQFSFLRWNSRPPHSNMPRMQISTRLIENGIIGCLFLIALFAPHSIAVTQARGCWAWLFWLLRFAFIRAQTLSLAGRLRIARVLRAQRRLGSFLTTRSCRSERCARRVCSRSFTSCRRTCRRCDSATARADVDRIVHDQRVSDCGTVGDRQGREGAGRQGESPLAKACFAQERSRNRRRS